MNTTQPKKTRDDIVAILGQIQFMDREFRLIENKDGWFIQVTYFEEDIDTNKRELQKARKWYISPFSTHTEIVETVFAACCRSMMHVTKEHFLYRGHRVYSPHFDINARLAVCQEEKLDKRIPLPGEPE